MPIHWYRYASSPAGTNDNATYEAAVGVVTTDVCATVSKGDARPDHLPDYVHGVAVDRKKAVIVPSYCMTWYARQIPSASTQGFSSAPAVMLRFLRVDPTTTRYCNARDARRLRHPRSRQISHTATHPTYSCLQEEALRRHGLVVGSHILRTKKAGTFVMTMCTDAAKETFAHHALQRGTCGAVSAFSPSC